MRRFVVALAAALLVGVVPASAAEFDPWAYDTKVEMAEAWFACCYTSPDTPQYLPEPIPVTGPFSLTGTRQPCGPITVRTRNATAEQARNAATAVDKLKPWFPDWAFAGDSAAGPADLLIDYAPHPEQPYAAAWAAAADRGGLIVVNTDQRFANAGAVPVVMHELGHIVGLDHVTDYLQKMNTTASLNVGDDWGSGDRAGLDALGCARP
jgi:hypothetical protein